MMLLHNMSKFTGIAAIYIADELKLENSLLLHASSHLRYFCPALSVVWCTVAQQPEDGLGAHHRLWPLSSSLFR